METSSVYQLFCGQNNNRTFLMMLSEFCSVVVGHWSHQVSNNGQLFPKSVELRVFQHTAKRLNVNKNKNNGIGIEIIQSHAHTHNKHSHSRTH